MVWLISNYSSKYYITSWLFPGKLTEKQNRCVSTVSIENRIFSIFFHLPFQWFPHLSVWLLSFISHCFLSYFFQVFLYFPYNIFLHALFPPSFSPSLAFLSFILAAVRPSCVLPSLKHSALISKGTGSLLLCSALHTLFTYFLLSFPSSLFSMEEATRCDLYAGGNVKSLPVGCIQPGPAVLLLIKFSSKAHISLRWSQTRTNRERRSDSSPSPAPSVCFKILSPRFDSFSRYNYKSCSAKTTTLRMVWWWTSTSVFQQKLTRSGGSWIKLRRVFKQNIKS